MQIDRALAAAALVLASGALHAYQIVEGRYRVETSPGVFQDQLIVRCDDARTLTVPWETKLAEACSEGLMGEPLPKAASRPQPTSAAPAAPLQNAEKPAPTAPVAIATEATPASLLDEKAQKDAMLSQVRAQIGNVPEHYIEFKPGADGLSMRFLPPLSDIVKKYETCRRARDLSADCGGERDRALAKLSEGSVQSSASRPDKPSAPAHKSQAAATDTSAQPPRSAAVATPPAQPDPARPAVQPPPATPDRAAAEQRIGEDYAWCMRSKPKFDCEQARAKALSALEQPKAGKTKRAGKQAGLTPKVATAQ